jgi:hypothetical protein
MKLKNPPRGVYPGEGALPNIRFRATGEFRPPMKGEYYLSGAIVEAYRARADLGSCYWIAEAVEMVRCVHCDGAGKVVRDANS